MKVKINDTYYDSEETPIMVILTDSEKCHIRNMPNGNYKYVSFPDTMLVEEIKDWMNEKNNTTI